MCGGRPHGKQRNTIDRALAACPVFDVIDVHWQSRGKICEGEHTSKFRSTLSAFLSISLLLNLQAQPAGHFFVRNKVSLSHS